MFAQLDTKTVYSFMDSLIDLEGMLKRLISGYQTVGNYDKDNLYAAFLLHEEAKKQSLQLTVKLELSAVEETPSLKPTYLHKIQPVIKI